MCSSETLGFWRHSPSSRIGHASACGKVDGVKIGAVGFQIECLDAARPLDLPFSDNVVSRRVRRCACEATCERRNDSEAKCAAHSRAFTGRTSRFAPGRRERLAAVRRLVDQTGIEPVTS